MDCGSTETELPKFATSDAFRLFGEVFDEVCADSLMSWPLNRNLYEYVLPRR
jgi:hypothetical protein